MSNEPATTRDREIVLSRVFDAPRELVFDAWTDPVHIAEWWGPNGFTTTLHEMDVRVGGRWRFVMHGPDGIDYPNEVIYTEVLRPERLVYDHGSGTDDSDRFEATVTFVERAGKTEITLRMVLSTVAERERTVGFGAVELGYQTLERFAKYLATLS